MSFLKDENGQATTEYVLILSVAVGLAVVVIRTFIAPFYKKLSAIISSRIQREIFGADMHTFRVRR